MTFPLPQLQKIRSFTAQAGFTMIELLVVIAVIGVLAVAVLSTINPIEQINKGRDTRTRSDAAQLLNAIDRYYAIQERYPWNTTSPTFTAAVVDPANEWTWNTAGDFNWADILTSTNEVKNGFITRLEGVATPYHIRLWKGALANSTTYACFVPTSQAFKLEAVDKCNTGAVPGGNSGGIGTPGAVAGQAAFDPCVSNPAVVADNNMICLP